MFFMIISFFLPTKEQILRKTNKYFMNYFFTKISQTVKNRLCVFVKNFTNTHSSYCYMSDYKEVMYLSKSLVEPSFPVIFRYRRLRMFEMFDDDCCVSIPISAGENPARTSRQI